MENTFKELVELLRQHEELGREEGGIKKNKVQELARKNDEQLIELLLSNPKFKELFFVKVKSALVFNKEEFISLVYNKEFLPDSYTGFANKIGLAAGEDYLHRRQEVVLNWPHKDCMLEGGMTKEDQGRDEIFWNEVIAPEHITRLKSPKAFMRGKRATAKGEAKLTQLNRNKEGLIKDNLIIKGNNLLALYSLREQFAGKIKLIYIDPPYNTENDEFKYNDRFNRASWLTFMKNRLEMARELLADDGSIYINIDFNEVHYLKVLMDDIFGEDNFQREIIWRIGWLSGYKTAAKNYIRNHDTILYYTKRPNKALFNKAYIEKKDFSERFSKNDINEILARLQELKIGKEESKDFVNFISEVGLPDKYPIEDTWNSSVYDKLNSIAVVSYSGEKVSKMLGTAEFKCQKAEKLLKRMIEISTNPGDLVLDYHLGTGTTCAAAHKMGRQYIGIEQMDYIEDIAVERMKKVIAGEQAGISKELNWTGGGEFVYLELAEWNQKWIKEINNIKNSKQAIALWDELKTNAFLSYKIDISKVDKNAKSINDLSLEDQKRFLQECLDANHLYINYSELEDEDHGLSKEDKLISKSFYQDN